MGKRKRGAKPDKFRVGEYTLDIHRGVYVARFYDENSGQYKKLKLGDRGVKLTEEQAQAELQRFVDSQNAIVKLTADYTCGQLWAKWLADREKDGFSNEIYGHQWKALRPHFEHRRPSELTADDYRAYADVRFALGRKNWTVNTELNRLSNCLAWACNNRLIGEYTKVWRPARGEGRKERITFDQAKAILDQAGDPHVRLFILLLMVTGPRKGAVLDLRWDQVDFEDRMITYMRQEDTNPRHKNYRKARAKVPFGQLVYDALKIAYAGARTEYVIEHGGERVKDPRAGFANAVFRAGMNPKVITPHVLRHSVATWAREKGDDWHRIAMLLGHEDSKTTELFYTHVDPKKYLTDTVEYIESKIAPLPTDEIVVRKKGTWRGSKRASGGT